MIASLPMYDWPEIREATDAFWQAICERLGTDIKLDRAQPFDHAWRQPDLLFSQTCGYPFTHEFKGVLTYVATPHYAAEGCVGASYCSMIFARKDWRRPASGHKSAINGFDSMSGMLALRLCGLLGPNIVVSGSHATSLAMVQAGDADVCAIDAVCVALARQHRPWLLEGLSEVMRSPRVPGLPFVTRAGDVANLRSALAGVFRDHNLASARKSLLLAAISDLEADAYDAITTLETQLNRAPESFHFR